MTIRQQPLSMGEAPCPQYRIQIWWQTIRPRTLVASIGPVLLGLALAQAFHTFDWLAGGLALMAAVLLQIGANLANDLGDFVRGADSGDRLGPPRAAQQGWLSPKELRRAVILVLAAATTIGIALIAIAGWPVLWIGIASLICALAYTAGPFPLAYLGIADLFVFGFFGPVAVAGTFYVQGGVVPDIVVLASIPSGFLVTAILVVNNLRDRHSDELAGKKTLAVRLGARGARFEYIALVLGAYLATAGLQLHDGVSASWLLPLLSLPIAAHEIRGVLRHDGAALNARLAGTARLGLLFAILLCIGVLW